MPISQANQVDYLFKKIGYGVTTTANAAVKSPSNESIPSTPTLRGDIIWQQSASVPATIPSSNSSVVTIYADSVSSTVQTTADATSPNYQTWKTGLTNWVDPSFGSTYQVKVYLASTGTVNPQTAGTQLFPDGTGNDDEWFFDYDSGVLTFPDNIPAVVNGTSGKTIFVAGARYTGQLGISNFVGNVSFGNITVANVEIVSTFSANTITANTAIVGGLQATAIGNVTPGSGVFTTLTSSSTTTLGLTTATALNNTPIGNAVPNYGSFSTLIVSSGGITNGGNLSVTSTANSTSTTTGALILGGGAGIAGNIYAGGLLSVAGNATTNNLSTNQATLSSIAATTNSITIATGATGVVSLVSTTALGMPAGSTSARPTGVAGYLRFNTDLGALEYYTGTAWVGLNVGISDQQLTPDGVSTTYTLNETTTTVGILVSINGTLQQPFTAYNVSGTQITFTEVLQATDLVDIRFVSSSVVPDLSNYSGNVRITGNVTLTGVLQAPQMTMADNSVGTAGQIAWDANYIYVCTATNTWKRVSLASF